MAEVVSTMTEGNMGEINDIIDDDSVSLKSWLVNKGHKVKAKTYQILIEQGIDTIEDFKQFTVDDFDNMCVEMETNKKIVYADRVKLKRVLESFSAKDKFVDPEEVSAIDNIKNEINKLKNVLDNLNLTQTQINQKKDKITKDINNTFEELVTQLRKRQKQLLSQLNDIMKSKNKLVNNHINIANNNIRNYQQQMQKCQKMIRQPIDLSELKQRKLQIITIRDGVVKANKKVMNSIRNKVNINTAFKIEKDTDMVNLKKIGVILENAFALPKLVEVVDDGAGNVRVMWNWSYKKKAENYDKLAIEWSLVKKNRNKIWNYKEVSIEETKEDVVSNTILLDVTGLHLFRIKVCDSKKEWTPYSNTKSLHIKDLASDTWFERMIGDYIQIRQQRIAVFQQNFSWRTAFGNAIVKPGEIHEWKLKLNTNFEEQDTLYIGIISDQQNLLREKLKDRVNDDFVYKAHQGKLRHPSSAYPGAKFTTKGDILEIKLDLRNNEVHMSLNGVKYGAVPQYKPKTQNYRLAVSISNLHKLCELELL